MYTPRGFPGGAVVKNPPANAEGTGGGGPIPGWENPLKEEMTTHFSILAWRIPWTEEPSGVQFIELQRVGNDCNGSVFLMIQLSHPYMTTGKTTPLTVQIFVGKIMSLLFNTLSSFVRAFLPRTEPTYTHIHYMCVHIYTRLIYTSFTCKLDYYIRLLKIVVVQLLSCV